MAIQAANQLQIKVGSVCQSNRGMAFFAIVAAPAVDWLTMLLILVVVLQLLAILFIILKRRKKPDHQLLAELKNLRTLIDAIPDYLYIKDLKHRFVVANASVAKNINRSKPQELIGKTDHDFFHKDLADKYRAAEQVVMSSGNAIINHLEPSIDDEGKRIYVSSTKVPLCDSQGRVIGLVGVGRNVTRERLSEMEITAKSEVIVRERNQLRSLIDNIPDCIYIKDKIGRIIVANKHFAQIVGYSHPGELLMKNDYQLFTKDLADRYSEQEQNVMLSGQITIHEEPIVTAKGQSILGSTTLIPFKDNMDVVIGVIGIRRDITDAKRVEYLQKLNALLEEKQKEIIMQAEELGSQKEQLERSNKELLTLNSTKDKFFSIIAHDLKNPFFAIASLSEIFLNDYGELPDQERIQLVRLINQSAQKTFNLFENLLNWARAQTNQIRYNPQIFDLKIVVEENLRLIQIAAKSKGITISNGIMGCNPVLADKDMISLVVRNLLSNAIKFTPPNGTVAIKCLASNEFVELSIEDNGVGIEEVKQRQLFKIEHQVNSLGTKGETGTGLGLIVCKEFVASNFGEIHVQSKPGVGSVFSITIPSARV